MAAEYEVIIADDEGHEKVFAEIRLGYKLIASISQEEGSDRLVLELPGPQVDETLGPAASAPCRLYCDASTGCKEAGGRELRVDTGTQLVAGSRNGDAASSERLT